MSADHLPLRLDPSRFVADFDRRPFTIGHTLDDHPLLRLDRLVELAATLPPELVEYNAGELPVSQDPALTPRNGLSPVETVRRIADNSSWLVLKRVERDPRYAALLGRCIEQLRPLVERLDIEIHQREAFIFVSSPRAVTPFHIDPEHNFLLQVKGSKTMNVWRADDRAVIGEEQLERYFASAAHRNLEHRPEFDAHAGSFVLQPGYGLHVPIASPHWVQNGDQVSVSLSITFRTRRSVERERLYQLNARLRRLGVQPTPPRRSALRDRVKLVADRWARRGRRGLRALLRGGGARAAQRGPPRP